jgi:hypothetical protein
MMSAVNTRTPMSSASSRASLVTGTSKARMTPNFFTPRSIMALARITSRLCTGPRLMQETGILTSSERRNSSSASSEPSVEACTATPSPDLSTDAKMSCMSSITSALIASTSSPGRAT